MKTYIKLKSQENNEFLKIVTRYSKEHKALLLSINHVIHTYIEKDKIQFEQFKPTKGILIKLLDMPRDNKKIVENYQPENLNMYIERICKENNLIIE